MWPFVMRFTLRLRNHHGSIQHAFDFFRENGINILFVDCIRSGHHHITLNALGEHRHLQVITINRLTEELHGWLERLPKGRTDRNAYLAWLSLLLDKSAQSHSGHEHRNDKKHNQWWYNPNEKLDWKAAEDTIFEKIGEYLLRQHKDKHLKQFLESETKNAQPVISTIQQETLKRGRSSHEEYQCVEYQTLPVRVLLDAILVYKNIICDYLKLRFIQDALEHVVLDEKNPQLSSCYLYNIQFYGGIESNAPFGFGTLKLFNSRNHFSAIVNDIKDKLGKMKNELKRPTDFGTRIDLDPILISSVESLSHAYYHRMFARYFISVAQAGFIPFPDLREHPTDFLKDLLPDRKAATLAIASSNTDDYTLRLCPIPISNLKRFRSIKVEEYARECPDQCSEKWSAEMKDCGIINLEAKPAAAIASSRADSQAIPDGKSYSSGDESQKDPDCTGSSVGLVASILRCLEKVQSSNAGPQHLLRQWRVYNQLFKITRNHESGAIHLLVEATGRDFFGFPSGCWDQELKERFDSKIGQDYPQRHIHIGRVRVLEPSGGRVIVSLSFAHPMKAMWMECITRIGKEMGFQSIFTVETFTRGVTDEVALSIRNSHAMLQILALPLTKESEHVDCGREDKQAKLMWLHAEYLTARTNGLRIVRLVDENSIDISAIPIGRDHASFLFSVARPFEDFENVVHEAFLHLRRDLADSLGLS